MSINDIKWLTVEEAAKIMRLSKMTVYRMTHSGELPSARFGKAIRIPEREIAERLKAYLPADTAEIERLRAAGRHMGGALEALGEVIRNAVRLAADTGDPAAALREIASYAQQAGVLDDLEPAGSPS